MTSSGETPDNGLKDTQDDMAIDENAGDFTGKPPAILIRDQDSV